MIVYSTNLYIVQIAMTWVFVSGGAGGGLTTYIETNMYVIGARGSTKGSAIQTTYISVFKNDSQSRCHLIIMDQVHVQFQHPNATYVEGVVSSKVSAVYCLHSDSHLPNEVPYATPLLSNIQQIFLFGIDQK